jgi:predicted Zn-ribbon and HTH transcriptional regulator
MVILLLRGRKMKIVFLTCRKCAYSWIPRKYPPKECPKCKSYHWEEIKELKKGVLRNVKA